jgi:hypothetical protein
MVDACYRCGLGKASRRREHVAAYRFRHGATSRKVAGSRPDEVIFFSNLPNPSSRTRPRGLLSP